MDAIDFPIVFVGAICLDTKGAASSQVERQQAKAEGLKKEAGGGEKVDGCGGVNSTPPDRSF